MFVFRYGSPHLVQQVIRPSITIASILGTTKEGSQPSSLYEVRGSGGSKGIEGLTGITAWSGIANSTTIGIFEPGRPNS